MARHRPVWRSLTMKGLLASIVAVVALLGLALPAEAAPPDGSVAEVMLEPGSSQGPSGDPSKAIQTGWWGKDGKDGGTIPSLAVADANGVGTGSPTAIAAIQKAFGTTDLSLIDFAFVPYSADGHNERPAVTKGQSAADVFQWFTAATFGTVWGTPGFVAEVNTKSQFLKWFDRGRLDQDYRDDLVLHDTLSSGSPVSANPRGTSILNTWPAGTKVSLVAYLSTGEFDSHTGLIPMPAVGKDGRVISAWLSFETVADPKRKAATSAGYRVLTSLPEIPKATATSGASGQGSEGSPAPGGSSADSGQGSSATPGTDPGGNSGKATPEETAAGADQSAGTKSDAATSAWLGLIAAVLVAGSAAAVTIRARRKRVSASGPPHPGATTTALEPVNNDSPSHP